ncbi:hypothetical protein BEP19_06675 [Ammoniphilus oxalaticus]|uniref:DUF3397 domain-containing protein n=1 Tax=Ammoniphilus oxalaticus TaxID=66863 RepID=A0A419SJD1_9BACL|nr:DUF3397 domain-containing protein [Ammoniphilus oxalaticus]RKD24087.1 hypothetical protein BEP19_06675 [Ammoniphilus oxalaticus]
MEAIANLLAGVLTIPVFTPFVVFATVFLLFQWKNKSRKVAIGLAVNVTTFFLIVAVTMFYNLTKQDGTIGASWWVLLFFVTTGGAIAWLQYKIKGQVELLKMIRAVWRLAFVCFTFAYIILFFFSIQHFLSNT